MRNRVATVFADSIPFTGVVRDVEFTAAVRGDAGRHAYGKKGKTLHGGNVPPTEGKTWASKARWGDVWQPDKGASARAAETSDKSDVTSSVRHLGYLPPLGPFCIQTG